MSKKLKDAYTLGSKEDTINLYKYWSKDYDEDFAVRNNYKSPSLHLGVQLVSPPNLSF